MRSGNEASGGESDTRPSRDMGRRPSNDGQRVEPARLIDAFDQARRSFRSGLEAAQEHVEDRPLRTLALAVGAGYLLGGGLFTALTGRLLFGGLRIGIRLAALPLVREELLGIVETVMDRGRGETERRQQ